MQTIIPPRAPQRSHHPTSNQPTYTEYIPLSPALNNRSAYTYAYAQLRNPTTYLLSSTYPDLSVYLDTYNTIQ